MILKVLISNLQNRAKFHHMHPKDSSWKYGAENVPTCIRTMHYPGCNEVNQESFQKIYKSYEHLQANAPCDEHNS